MLAVFENLQPGERREARICHAPVIMPAERKGERVAIERT